MTIRSLKNPLYILSFLYYQAKINSKKNSSYQKGLYAEQAAKNYLQTKNLQFITNRLKTPFGEIDLLMQYNNILIAVEVKLRNTTKYGTATDSLSSQQVQRIGNALTYYQQKKSLKTHLRIDLICFNKNQPIKWLKNID